MSLCFIAPRFCEMASGTIGVSFRAVVVHLPPPAAAVLEIVDVRAALLAADASPAADAAVLAAAADDDEVHASVVPAVLVHRPRPAAAAAEARTAP